MTSNHARQLWESGIPLCNAWLHLANATDQAALKEMPGALDAMAKFASDHPGGGLNAIADALALGVRTSQDKRAMLDRLREDLLTDIFNGQLIATGFRERPSLSSAPVLIDADHFDDGEADWEWSKFTANGRLWNRVKVSAPAPPRVRNIPNSREAIERAIHALIAKNADFAKTPGKIRCDAVRSELGEKYLPGNGLSDQNIEKHFVRICGTKRISKISK